MHVALLKRLNAIKFLELFKKARTAVHEATLNPYLAPQTLEILHQNKHPSADPRLFLISICRAQPFGLLPYMRHQHAHEPIYFKSDEEHIPLTPIQFILCTLLNTCVLTPKRVAQTKEMLKSVLEHGALLNIEENTPASHSNILKTVRHLLSQEHQKVMLRDHDRYQQTKGIFTELINVADVLAHVKQLQPLKSMDTLSSNYREAVLALPDFNTRGVLAEPSVETSINAGSPLPLQLFSKVYAQAPVGGYANASVNTDVSQESHPTLVYKRG